MRRALAYPAGIGLVLLAFGVSLAAPHDDDIEAPFPVTGDVGELIVSQHQVVTVHAVSLAREVELDSWEGTTAGVWLVVEATLASRVESTTVEANLFLDGVRFPGSNRPGTDVLGGRIADAGFPRVGAILIELPADVVERPGAHSATLRIASGTDVRLDSVVELSIDLPALELHDRVELEPTKADAR